MRNENGFEDTYTILSYPKVRITMTILGILPARAGSKGIKDKNLKFLAGKPLLSWAAQALDKAQGVDVKICSTDSLEIAQVAAEAGLDVPFLRPDSLAKDDSQVLEAIRHALTWFSERGNFFSHVVLVQATSPTVTEKDIETGIQMVREGNFDSVVSAFEFSHHLHPAMMFEATESRNVTWLLGNHESSKRRQDRERFLVRTGLVYVFSARDILEENSLWGERIGYFEVEKDRAICIDDLEDFQRAEQYFAANGGPL